MRLALRAALVVATLLPTASPAEDSPAGPRPEDWIQLFNGRDLEGWIPKIRGYAAGDNFGNTFRVENGVLKVVLRSLRQVRRPLRPSLLRTGVLALPSGRGVQVRGRAGEGRSRLGLSEQRPHDPRPARRDHGQGPGLPDLDRGAAARRPRVGKADDRQPVHAGDERGHGRAAHHRALHQLELEDLRRRRVGAGRGRGPRERPGDAPGGGRAGARSTRSPRSAAGWSPASTPR